MWLSLGLNFASLVFLSILPNVFGICVGRLIAGIAMSLVTFHMPEYMEEIAEVCLHYNLFNLLLKVYTPFGVSQHLAKEEFFYFLNCI